MTNNPEQDSILDVGLPGDPYYERLVLGAALAWDRWAEVSGSLTAGDFSLEGHRRIYHRMDDLAKRGEPIDYVTVYHELEKHRQAESIGGLGYLVELVQDLAEPTKAHLSTYARYVLDSAIRRRALSGCQALQNECMDVASSTLEIAAQFDQFSKDLQSSLPTVSSATSPAGILAECGVSALFGDGLTVWVKTPWDRLNRFIGGFEPGQLVIVGGLPGTGKSVFLNQCAWAVSESNKRAAVFSIEMTRLSLLQRFVSSRAAVGLQSLRAGQMLQRERERARDAMHEAEQNENIELCDREKTMPAIRAELSRMVSKGKIDLIAIDYIQLLITGKGRQSQTEELTQISRDAKLLAGEFGCPVLIGSQFSRESEKEGREPRLSDLRQSGSLEQDADTVIFLHQAKIQDPDSTDRKVEFIVAKNRNGRCGRVPMTFERQFVRFSE